LFVEQFKDVSFYRPKQY